MLNSFFRIWIKLGLMNAVFLVLRISIYIYICSTTFVCVCIWKQECILSLNLLVIQQTMVFLCTWRSKVCVVSDPLGWQTRLPVAPSALRKPPLNCWLFDSLNFLLQCCSRGVSFWHAKINVTWHESKYRAVLRSMSSCLRN